VNLRALLLLGLEEEAYPMKSAIILNQMDTTSHNWSTEPICQRMRDLEER
jgi:hypothetical protein